jgi:hypothetical protein
MQHNQSTFIWKLFPPLAYVQFPWRFLAISVFFVSSVGIVAFYLIKEKLAIWLSLLVIILVIAVNIGYFRPDFYYDDSIDAHYVSKEALSVDDRLPKDYLPVWVKVIEKEKITTPQVLMGEAMITNYYQVGTRIHMAVNSPEGATIEVPATYFPGWQATVNGKKTETFPVKNLGIIAFEVPAGATTVWVKFGNTITRTISDIISLLSLGVVVLLLWDKKDRIKLFNRI